MLLLSAFSSALIVGLLAMHTIASAGGHNDSPTHTAMVIDAHESSMGTGTASVDDCDGPCDPAHGTAMMACILVLLVGVLVIGTSRRISHWSYPRLEVSSATKTSRRLSRFSLPPPDLDILSISRT